MQINITGRHLQITDEVRAYIVGKAEKLPRFYDRIHEVEVVIDYDSAQFTAEMIVRADMKHTFVAKDSGADAAALIDQLSDKLERQLKKHKEKTRDHKHDGKPAPTNNTTE